MIRRNPAARSPDKKIIFVNGVNFSGNAIFLGLVANSFRE
jgi:hypothetical protein